MHTSSTAFAASIVAPSVSAGLVANDGLLEQQPNLPPDVVEGARRANSTSLVDRSLKGSAIAKVGFADKPQPDGSAHSGFGRMTSFTPRYFLSHPSIIGSELLHLSVIGTEPLGK